MAHNQKTKRHAPPGTRRTGGILIAITATVLPLMGATGFARATAWPGSPFDTGLQHPLILLAAIAGFCAMAGLVTVMFRKALNDQARFMHRADYGLSESSQFLMSRPSYYGPE